MLLDNNTKKVFDLIDMYDNLSNINKEVNKHLNVHDYCYAILNN